MTRLAPRLRRREVMVAASIALSRLTGFGRVLALAHALAFTRLTDAYNLANTTPNIVYELVLGGIVTATLVPVFVEVLNGDDEDEAWRAVSAVCTLALVAAVVAAVALAVVAPGIVAAYTARVTGQAAVDQRQVATSLLRLFAPQVALYAVAAVAGAVLFARRRFVAPNLTPVLNNLLVIAVLLATPRLFEELTLASARDDPGLILFLGIGTTAGVALQAVALAPALRRSGARLRPVWLPRHPAVRKVLRLSGWTAAYVLTNQLTLWLVLVIANQEAGDVSAYQAAHLFFQLPFAVAAVTVMTIRLPESSDRWAVGDREGYLAVVRGGIRPIVFLLVPAAAGYVLLASPIVRLLLEHGALSSSSASTTAEVLAAFSVGLPAFGVYLFLMNGYQAMQNTRAMFAVYCVENGLNVALAVALHPVLGVRGLGFAFALAYVGGTVVAARDVGRRAGGPVGLVPALGATLRPLLLMTVPVAMGSWALRDASGVALGLGVVAVVGAGAAIYLLAARSTGALDELGLGPVEAEADQTDRGHGG
jgi:putative peptidoglycan lipid II flippase